MWPGWTERAYASIPLSPVMVLYLLIPLGSWAGGAIVERLVDSLLG